MRRSAGSRGFTLIEAVITLVILAMAVAIVIPAISNVSRAELRQSASKLSGAVRNTYDMAALSGQTHRLVFDLKESTIKSEQTDQVLAFGEGNALVESAGKLDSSSISSFLELDFELPEDLEEDLGFDVSAVSALFGINRSVAPSQPAGAETFSEGKDLELAGDVRVLDIWVEGMDKPAAEDETVYLYFFPHGFTQDAVINLEDDGGRVFSVRVWALTGKTRIEGEYREPPK